MFPISMYPKEIISRREIIKKHGHNKAKLDEALSKQDFFNLIIYIVTDTPHEVVFVEKCEFLMQSIVLQIEDEIIGYILRYYESIAESMEVYSMTGVHSIFKSLQNAQGFALQSPSKDIYPITEEESN